MNHVSFKNKKIQKKSVLGRQNQTSISLTTSLRYLGYFLCTFKKIFQLKNQRFKICANLRLKLDWLVKASSYKLFFKSKC